MDVLFDSYFVLSDIMTEHHQHVYSVIDLLAELGGLFSSILAIAFIIATRLNREFLLNKIARAMYFIKQPDNDNHEHQHHQHDDGSHC